jgi:putative transcriptional regulator
VLQETANNIAHFHKDTAMKEKLQNIGRNIRNLRKIRRWTQEELANRAGISRIALIHIESNKALPTLETLASLSSQLDVTLEELFTHGPIDQNQSTVLAHARTKIQSGTFSQSSGHSSARQLASNLALVEEPRAQSRSFQELVQQLNPAELQAVTLLMAELVESR